MELACGGLEWTPREFWRATFPELWAAALGRYRATHPEDAPNRGGGLSQADRERMREVLDAAPDRVESIRGPHGD